MSSHPIFETVRQHLQQGETGAALQTMITFLEAEDKQGERLHTLRVVQANYNAARQQELKGILAFQEAQREYSKVNDAVLSTIAELTTGRPSHTVPPAGATRYRLPIIVGGAVLLLAIAAAVWFFNRSQTAVPAAQQREENCPVFGDADYKIMLIPFLSLNDKQAKPEVSIQVRIRELTANNGISADVEVAAGDMMESLPDLARAKHKGDQCKANVVVWGQYEKVGDSTLVDVHYVFTEGSGVISGRTDFHPFKSLAMLQQSGNSSGLRSLDDAILSLCSVMAVHAGRPEVAEKWLNQIRNTSEKDDNLQQAITKVKEMKESGQPAKERLKERLKK
jgi:Effector-associated domain 11